MIEVEQIAPVDLPRDWVDVGIRLSGRPAMSGVPGSELSAGGGVARGAAPGTASSSAGGVSLIAALPVAHWVPRATYQDFGVGPVDLQARVPVLQFRSVDYGWRAVLRRAAGRALPRSFLSLNSASTESGLGTGSSASKSSTGWCRTASAKSALVVDEATASRTAESVRVRLQRLNRHSAEAFRGGPALEPALVRCLQKRVSRHVIKVGRTSELLPTGHLAAAPVDVGKGGCVDEHRRRAIDYEHQCAIGTVTRGRRRAGRGVLVAQGADRGPLAPAVLERPSALCSLGKAD